jgi:pimeloyl-ACP methyl ester carboxylesterase
MRVFGINLGRSDPGHDGVGHVGTGGAKEAGTTQRATGVCAIGESGFVGKCAGTSGKPGAPAAPLPIDFKLSSGTVHALRFGSPTGYPVIGLPGISQTSDSLRVLGAGIGGDDIQFIAVDPRGRGQSPATGKGTYGWENHARDVLEIADQIHAAKFGYVGHSMGAYVAIAGAGIDPSRFDRLVLVDACGLPDKSVGKEMAKRAIKLLLRPKLFTVVKEDAAYAREQAGRIHELWKALADKPVLLLRAEQEIAKGVGYCVPVSERDRFLSMLPKATSLDIDANHDTIIQHPDTLKASSDFLKSRS